MIVRVLLGSYKIGGGKMLIISELWYLFALCLLLFTVFTTFAKI